eukprot:PhM_4_TR11949/c0_g1_i1/m.35004
MSMFGAKEYQDDLFTLDAFNTLTLSADGESICARHWSRMMNCIKESQHLDVMYDCRSRWLDFHECTMRTKQSIWVFRESVVTMRNRPALKAWLRRYDEEFGHPPLLEAVDIVRKKIQEEGSDPAALLHPTHFKEPNVW